ncbi:ABC transporter permease [Bacteroidia bacterium]|nr:ABC transporter permease [Bacteroidia bacterium]
MVSLIIGLWCFHELHFDNFHKNKDRIYRVLSNGTMGLSGSFQMPFGQIAIDELPAIEDMCRIVFFNNNAVKINSNWFPNVPMLLTDTTFFSFFTFPLKGNDPVTIFSSRDKVVICESAITKYFSDQNPIGQIVRFNGQDFIVSGIMENVPNSSLQTDFIFPFSGWYANNGWFDNGNYMTFFLLHKDIAPGSLVNSLQEILYNSVEEFKNEKIKIELESLNDLHFGTNIQNDNAILKGNKNMIIIFALIAFVILVVSCINFTNLFISTSFKSAKSIGIKKTFGANNSILIREIFRETADYVFVSIFFGLCLSVIVLSTFNNFIQSDLSIDFSSLQLYCFLIGFFVFAVLLAGSFPAFYMTHFNVIETLSGKFKGKQISFFQKSLIVFQNTAAIALLIFVIVMQKQITYMISKDLGFDKENVIYMKLAPYSSDFSDKLLKYPNITDICTKSSFLTDWTEGGYFSKIPTNNNPVVMEVCRVSPNYFDFFKMKIVEGENPFPFITTNNNEVVINESAAKILELIKPIDQTIYRDNDEFIVKGVMSDVNTRSFHEKVGAQIYFKMEMPNGWGPVFFKIQGNPQIAINTIRQVWEEYIPTLAPGYPFKYDFLEDTYIRLYNNEMNAKKTLSFAVLITFIIAGSGLFAMVYYATQRRTREIALRKIHGASVSQLFFLLTKEFLLWMVIGFLIACPIAYLGLGIWLNNFTTKISLNILDFLWVGLLALVLTLLVTSYQTLKVATKNPLESLKTE